MRIENTDDLDADIKRMLYLAEQVGSIKKELEFSGVKTINIKHPYIDIIGELEALREKYWPSE